MRTIEIFCHLDGCKLSYLVFSFSSLSLCIDKLITRLLLLNRPTGRQTDPNSSKVMMFQLASWTAWLLILTITIWMTVTADESAVDEEPTISPTVTWMPTVTWPPTVTPNPFFVIFEPTTPSPTFESEVSNFDCFNCIESGYSFCPLDAHCYPNATSPFEITTDLPILPFSCQTIDDMLVEDTQLCSPPENFFSDPLYSTNEWVFDMINVRPVWEKGYFGTSVAIRVNDDGLLAEHVEVRTYVSI
jgi:hypothetical protein